MTTQSQPITDAKLDELAHLYCTHTEGTLFIFSKEDMLALARGILLEVNAK